MNWLESSIAAISPQWAYSRTKYRHAKAAYDAAKPSRLRKDAPDNRSGDAVTGLAGAALRGYARALEQNYDVAKGVLDVLVNNTIGPNGISIEPLPRNKDGIIHEDFAKELLALWEDFRQWPDVTWEHDYASMERLAARTWFRDGELLAQLVEDGAYLNHGTIVPLSIELIEADHLPFDLNDSARGITQGVERSAWGRPTGYHIYKQHPGDTGYSFSMDTKRVGADKMLHMKIAQRIRQARGVSVFASVMRRLEDLKDYEESERIAARVAAAMTGYIKKGASDDYVPPTEAATDRQFRMQPGLIFDNLKPGEEVGTIDSSRPSGLLTGFHAAMTRFIAAGVGASGSSVSRDYNGTYSAQRQELVETWGNYAALTNLWIGQFPRPIYHRFIEIATAAGLVKIPRDLDQRTIKYADFRGPAMPWIDPVKEIGARVESMDAQLSSPQQHIRELGRNPRDTLAQIAQWQAENKRLGIETKYKTGNPKAPDNSGVSVSEDQENAQTNQD